MKAEVIGPARIHQQRKLVQKNLQSRFRVKGYHTGDFIGSLVESGWTGAEFVIERALGATNGAVQIGERIWVPFADYITLTLDNGGDE